MSGIVDRVVVLVVGAWLVVPPLALLSFLGALAPSIPIMLVTALVCIFAAWFVFEQVALFISARLDRWQLRRQLDARIRQSLRDAEAASNPAALEQIKRDLWRQEQLTALVALRRRFAAPPRAPRLLDLDLLREMYALLIYDYGAVAVTLSVVCVGIIIAAYIAAPAGEQPWIGLAFTGMVSLVTPWMLAAKAITYRREQRLLHVEFVREERRIAAMTELSGGLTLAGHDLDAALSGTLSEAEP